MKDLALDASSTETVVCEVVSGRDKMYSKDYKNQSNSSNTAMCDHIFIEKRNQSVQDLQNLKVKVSLLVKSAVFKNTVIGVYEFDFSYIYFMEEHAMKHMWVAMSNPSSDDYSAITAFLKLSVSIHGANDTPTLLVEDTNNSEELLMSSAVKPTFTQLKLHFIKGEHLPKMDAATLRQKEGKMDAYFKAEIGGKKIKTSVKTTVKDEAYWFETMLIPVRKPVIANKLVLELWDEDDAKDEIAGSLFFTYDELFSRPSGSFFWVNVLGPQGGDEQGFFKAAAAGLKSRPKEYDELCHDPTIANVWKCRVLIGVEYEESESPQLAVEPIKDVIQRQRSQPYLAMSPFQFQFLAGSVICTPEADKDYRLMLQIAEHKFTTNKGTIGRTFVRWNEMKTQTEILMPYQSVDAIGTIFVYLCDAKGNKLSYCKFQAKEFSELNAALQWYEFTADPVLKEIESPEKAGFCSFRLSIAKGTAQQIQFANFPEWKKRVKPRPDAHKIRAYVYQARELPAADDTGTSDPVLKFFDHQYTAEKRAVPETRCVEETCYPMYYQCLELVVEGDTDELPPFLIDIYDIDHKLIGKDKRDYMCRCVIPVKEAAIKTVTKANDDGIPPSPTWHKCYFQSGQKACGEILVSFIKATEFDHRWKVPQENLKMMGILNSPADRDAIVQFDEFNIEINVLGLRSLASSGLLPVKKAYVQFGLKTLVPPLVGATIEDITTTPGPSGPDPTINTVVSFKMLLPEDPKFAPSMACRVYDKIFTGFDGQLIGVFTIPIGNIMHDQRSQHVLLRSKLKNLIEQLQNFRDQKAVATFYAKPLKDESKDQNFRQQVQTSKDLTKKVFSEDSIKGKTADEQIMAQQAKNLKKPLIQATDEDSDEDGNTLTRPVGIRADTAPYEAPRLNFNQGPDEATIKRLQAMPRDQLTEKERQMLNQALLKDVINTEVTKKVNTLPKDQDPNDPRVFKPVASPRASFKVLDNALKQNYGQSTDTSLGALNGPANIVMLDKLKGGLNTMINEAIDREVQLQVGLEQKEYQISLAAMNATDKSRVNKIIIEPQYILDKRLNVMIETNEPPSNLFEGLGWDRIPNETHEKHYRRFYTTELEHCKEIMNRASDFNQYELSKGQVRGANKGFMGGLFSSKKVDAESGQVNTTEKVGLFKGIITVSRASEDKERREEINVLLRQVYQLLCEIHFKMYHVELEFKPGVLGEVNQHKLQHQMTSKRDLSSDCDSGWEESKKGKPGDPQYTDRNKKRNRSSRPVIETVMEPECRARFREKMINMGLGGFGIGALAMEALGNQVIKKMLLVEKRCLVRLYVLSCANLASRDNDSPSDPYLIVKLGQQEFNDRKNYIEDEENPKLYKKIEFEAVFPGCPQLKVALWDYDLLFGDDLIGETVIDLEDRYFSADWNIITQKPIEQRKLYHPSYEKDQGVVRLWVEILPTNQDLSTFQDYDITEKPAEEFEVRVCVFETEELKMMDIEGTTDGFVKTFFEPGKAKETDTHFRNQDGHCSWNYRHLHSIKDKSNNYKLTVQAYDRDLFASNDLIGESVIDLKPLIKDASLTKSGVSLNKRYYEDYLKSTFPEYTQLTFNSDNQSFWVELYSKEGGKLVSNGKLRLQIDVLPKIEAEKNKVGEAQSEPNVNPYLPKPENRMTLSLNPFEMIRQLLGPKFRRLGYAFIVTVLCIVVCVLLAPMILSDLVSKMILSIF